MAPSAQIYLACHGGDVIPGASGTNDAIVTAGQAKDQAKALHVDIIRESEGWVYDSLGDCSGGRATMDAIVTDAANNDILWVAPAGNSTRAHWFGTLSGPDGNFINNFAGNDEFNTIYPGFAINPGRA
jgi:hypothetical protein